jgi:hypothetical protein
MGDGQVIESGRPDLKERPILHEEVVERQRDDQGAERERHPHLGAEGNRVFAGEGFVVEELNAAAHPDLGARVGARCRSNRGSRPEADYGREAGWELSHRHGFPVLVTPRAISFSARAYGNNGCK